MPRRWRRWMSFAGVAAILAAGCGTGRAPRPFAQTGDHFYSFEPGTAGPITSGRWSYDSLARSLPGWPGLPIVRFRRATWESRLHPELRSLRFAAADDTTRITLVIAFADRIQSPRLPLELAASATDSVLALTGRSRIDSIIAEVRRDRQTDYLRQVRWLEKNTNAVVDEQFEVIQAVRARVPRNRVLRLANWNEVVSVRPERLRATLPQDDEEATGQPSVASSAAAMSIPMPGGAWSARGDVRLLDTGVDRSHPWFQGLPSAGMPGNSAALSLHGCVEAAACMGPDVDDCHAYGHGTASAAILVARGTAPPQSRGVTDAHVHSCRVSKQIDGGYVEHYSSAVLHALEAGFAPASAVALIELSDAEGPDGAIANAADHAFERGLVVIAPIGNSGAYDGTHPDTGPQSPGNARGVLGIGARLAGSAQQYASQSRGRLGERQKPDLQAYTGTWTAFRAAAVGPFSGTSGAAPYAAAAALAVRSVLGAVSPVVDPGQVYAVLLGCAQETRSELGRFPLVRGAGMPSLPEDGEGWFGGVDLSNGESKDIQLQVTGAGVHEICAGLWWKDPAPLVWPAGVTTELHRDFDLELRDPGGTLVASSIGADGVFERITHRAGTGLSLPAGTWRLRVRARSTGFWPATAYWALFAAP